MAQTRPKAPSTSLNRIVGQGPLVEGPGEAYYYHQRPDLGLEAYLKDCGCIFARSSSSY